MSHLMLTVPETVTSHYVIATNDPPDDPYAVVPWRVPVRFRKAVVEALASPRLGIFTIVADEAMWRLDDVLASDEDRRRIEACAYQILVVHRAAADTQPRGEQTARAVARAVADAANGVLIDPQARHVVLRDGLAHAEREGFRMGDQWFGTRYDIAGPDDAARTACGSSAAACSCLRLTLLGLRRFGLPDLVMDQVACAHDLAALNLLRAIACRLLTDQWRWAGSRPAQRTRLVPDRLEVRPADFWAFWAATPFMAAEPVVARLVATSRTMLEVGPPADHLGTRAEWQRDVLVPAMPSVVGCPADEDAPWPPSTASECTQPSRPFAEPDGRGRSVSRIRF